MLGATSDEVATEEVQLPYQVPANIEIALVDLEGDPTWRRTSLAEAEYPPLTVWLKLLMPARTVGVEE